MLLAMMKLNTTRINQRLEELGWSRYRLAHELGVSNQSLYRSLDTPESCTLKTLTRYAETLGLSVVDLIEEEV